MALSTRDLYLVLRARDEASRVLRGLSREMLATGAAARAASARANAAMVRQQMTAARAAGATAAQLAGMRAMATAWDNEANRIMRAAAARQRFANITSMASQAMITGGVVMAATGALTLTWMFRQIEAAKEWERQVKLTQTQTAEFGATFEQLSTIGLKVARTIGVAFDQIQPALFDIFSSTNANVTQAETLLTAFSKAAVAGQVDIQAAARATIAIMNAYNIPLENVNDVLDVQFQLVKYGVGTYEEFAGVIGNVIPSATRAGQSIETVAAMLAFLTRNGLSASMAATSAARALEAMSHPKTIDRLKKMGIDARDAAGNMRPMTEILGELRNKLNQMPAADRVKAIVDLLKSSGGTIQARRFLEQVLLRPGELEELQTYLEAMENSSGQFEAAYNTMADSVAARTQLLKNQWQALKIAIGEAVIPGFLSLMAVVSKVVEAFNNLPKGTKDAIGQFLVWGSVIGIVGGTLLIFLGMLAALIAAFAAGGAALLGFIAVIAALIGYVGAFVGFWVAVYAHSEKFRNGIQGLVVALQTLWAKVQEVAGPIAQQIQSVFGQKVIEALRIAGQIMGQVFDMATNAILNGLVPALASLKSWWDQNQATIQPLLAILAQVVKWFLIIAATIVAVLVGSAFAMLIAGIYIIIGTIRMVVAAIQWWIGYMQGLWAAVQTLIGWINSAKAAILTWAAQATTAVQNVKNTVTNAFASAGSWLYNAGRNIIMGLVNGIRSAIGAVRDALGAVTNMIPSWKGPKEKDLKLLKPTGGLLMRGLARGIREGSGMVKRALGDVTGQLGGVGLSTGGGPDVTPGRTYNQTVNVTTQELDPRYHAAQLGWEMMAVMP
jgi:TP901 family phage tail tape measure protein